MVIIGNDYVTRFNKIATQGAPQMAVDKEANSLSRVYCYYYKFNLREETPLEIDIKMIVVIQTLKQNT